MKKTILYIVDGTIKNPILESQTFPLLKYLSSMGFSVYFMSFENEKQNSFQFFDSINIYHKQIILKNIKIIPYKFLFFAKGMTALISLTRKIDFEIVHARSFYSAIFGLALKLIKPKVIFIYDNRGVYIDEEILKDNGRKTR